MKIYGREPVVYLNTIAAILGLVVSLGITGLTADMAGGIVAFITAVLGAVAAWRTKPVAPQAFTTVVAAGGVLLATFGFDASQAVIGAVNTVVLTALTLLTRAQVSPTVPAAKPSSVQPLS